MKYENVLNVFSSQIRTNISCCEIDAQIVQANAYGEWVGVDA